MRTKSTKIARSKRLRRDHNPTTLPCVECLTTLADKCGRRPSSSTECALKRPSLNTRIDHELEEVDNQIHHHREDRSDQHEALYRRIVRSRDRLHGILSDPVPIEN